MTVGERIEHCIQEFVSDQIKYTPEANKDILQFIAEIQYHSGTEEKETESIRMLFRAGYCYYFAMMLQDAFPGGTICWVAPFGHIVYQYHNIEYDIEGVYDGEADSFIPISMLGKTIDDYRHIPGREYNATEQELANIQLRYEKERMKKGE